MQAAAAQAAATLPYETQLKLRRASWVNFTASMLQLACSVTVIILTRYSLEGATVSFFSFGNGGGGAATATYNCLMATDAWPGACQFAYSVASISILLNFLLSLMQCLTMDCCGLGRLLECLADAGLIAWWGAAGITLGAKAAAANAAGLEKAGHRNAVVAMCWLSVALFAVLLAVNAYLTAKLGRAYVHVSRMQQAQAAAAAQQQHGYGGGGGYPGGGIQMASPVFPPGGGPPSAYAYSVPQHPQQQPGGAPWGAQQQPAYGTPAYGYPAGGGWGGPGAGGGGPPMAQAVVGAPVAVPAPQQQPGGAVGAVAPAYPPVGAGAGAGPSSGAAAPAAAQPGAGGGDKALAASAGNYLPPSQR